MIKIKRLLKIHGYLIKRDFKCKKEAYKFLGIAYSISAVYAGGIYLLCYLHI